MRETRGDRERWREMYKDSEGKREIERVRERDRER